jgi:hypothetical protein
VEGEREGDDAGGETTAVVSLGGGGLIASLPPIGASSFWNRDADGEEDEDAYHAGKDDDVDGARGGRGKEKKGKDKDGRRTTGITVSDRASSSLVLSSKFQLQYTCKVCDTRNSISISRMAYRNGVVIAICRGCDSKHLIADNFGWNKYAGGFDYDNGETDIESYMSNRATREMTREMAGGGGNEDSTMKDLVKRVSRDVFDLESMLYKGQGGGTGGGSIMTNDAEGLDKMEGREGTSWS